MAKVLTVSLDGLCGFADRTASVEAYLLSGHGLHGANLLMRTDFIDVPLTTWKPTRLGVIRETTPQGTVEIRQVGLWGLQGLTVTLTDVASPGKPMWTNKQHLIDLGDDHPGAKTKSKSDITTTDPAVGVVTLVGDKTKLQPQTPRQTDPEFVLKKKGVEHKKGKFARVVDWTVSSTVVPAIENSEGKRIILRKDLDEWWAGISNTAPVPADEGLLHFEHYYEGVVIAAGDSKMTIENAFADVYDCVPPTAWP